MPAKKAQVAKEPAAKKAAPVATKKAAAAAPKKEAIKAPAKAAAIAVKKPVEEKKDVDTKKKVEAPRKPAEPGSAKTKRVPMRKEGHKYPKMHRDAINVRKHVTALKRSKAMKTITLRKFYIDCSKPVADKIMDAHAFEQYLITHIKVGGKPGQLGSSMSISRDKGRIYFNVRTNNFNKRYIKYLTKKYLKKNQLRDWLHVIAPRKCGYELRYFNIHDEEEMAPTEDQ